MPVSEEGIKRAREAFSKDDKQKSYENPNKMDVVGYLAAHNIDVVKEKANGSSTLYCLSHCVFDPSHANNESAIGQAIDGKLFYQCFHNSCEGKTWKDARQIISGDKSLAEFFDRPFTKTKNGEAFVHGVWPGSRVGLRVHRISCKTI